MSDLSIRSSPRVTAVTEQPRVVQPPPPRVTAPDTFTPAQPVRLSERAPAAGDLAPMIEGVYQEVLGRPADAWGLQHWSAVTAQWRAAGMSDEQIRTRLVQEFQASPEARARHGGGAPPVEGPPPVEQPPAPVPPRGVDTGNYLGGNYTDLGRIDGQEAMPDPLTPDGAAAMRAAAARDLDRLAAEGVDHVRVWAQHPNGLTDPAAIGARIHILAEEARARGITLTVDLFDNYAVGGRNVDHYRALPMDAWLEHVVKPNAGFDIHWSLGNEIGDPDRPLEFAGWYEETAAKIREAGGPGTVISAQLVPGSVNHPWVNDEYAAAARRIIAASDVVSIHAYPEGPVGSQPWMGGIEQQSTEWWARETAAAGKTFTIGEFGLHEHLRTPENIEGWLRYYEEQLGADHVSLWQFMKDDVGHVDPVSWDLITGDHTNLDVLRAGGWLGREPK